MTKAKRTRDKDFTQGPMFGKLIMFALPLMATGLLQTLYNASDMVIVSNFANNGTDAMGAVSSCGPLISMIINMFTGLSVGSGVLSSHHVGAKKYDELKKVLDTSIIASVITGIVLAFIGFFLAEPLLILMKTPENFLPQATLYMKMYFLGIPGLMMYNFLSSILRSSGDSKRPLVFLAISGAANVLLNVILVFLLPDMGAMDVGIATAVSQYVSAVLVFVYMCRADIPSKIDLKSIKGDWKTFGSIVRIGLPAGIQGTLFSISNVLTQKTVNSYGEIVITGNGAAANIENFLYIAMYTFYQSTITFIGQNVGAGKYERVKKIIFQNTLLAVGLGLFLGVFINIFGDALLNIYAPDTATVDNSVVRAAGLNRFMIIGISYFLCGLMEVGCGAVRGMGKAMTPMFVSLAGSCLFRVVWILTVCKMFPTDIRVLYLCYPLSWIITSAAHFVCCLIIYKREYKPKLLAQRSEKDQTEANQSAINT